tara:strand:- start:13944 stop:14993 length:1050 start_codon:yes stop_codon:yes gene_type:complete
MTSGIGSNVLGHSHPRISHVIKDQVGILTHAQPNCYMPQNIDPLLKELEGVVHKNIDSAIFSLSGSEAIDHAIKIAKMHTKKRYVISLNNAFHGRTLAALSISSNNLQQSMGIRNIYPDCIQIDIHDDISNEVMNNTAAIIVEPIQGERGGYHIVPTQYLEYLHKLCSQHETLLIYDEVQSFLRTGKYFTYEYGNVLPDMIVIAKGLAGPLPLSCVLGNSKVMDNVPPGIIGGTFQGNALAFAVSTEILKIVKEENILENILKKSIYLRDSLYKHNDKIKYLRGLGLMIGIEFDTQEKSDKFFNLCLENDVLLMKTSFPKTVRLIPPLNISYDEINQFTDCVDKVITDI